jgi:hypothetical protein
MFFRNYTLRRTVKNVDHYWHVLNNHAIGIDAVMDQNSEMDAKLSPVNEGLLHSVN